MAAIDVESLARSFAGRRFPSVRPAVTALTDVSLSVARGEICGVLGANGAGKTTLLEILATLLRPDRGHARVDDRDVVADPAAVRKRIAYCPSGGTSFFPRLSGRDNLRFFGALHNVPSGALRERVQEATDRFQIAFALDRRVEAYSDGMRQRLALARAHVTRATVWLVDEPTRGLDPEGRQETGKVIQEQARDHGTTVLFTTHDLGEVATLCDHVIVLHGGRVAFDSTPAEAIARWGSIAGAYAAVTRGARADGATPEIAST